MKLLLGKYNERVFWILFFLIILSFLTFTSIFDLPDIYLVDREISFFSEGWTWHDGKSDLRIDLPDQINVGEAESLVIKNTLPNDFESGDTIAFKSYMQSVVVKIDSKTVYEVTNEENKSLGGGFDNFWVFVNTKPEYKGKEIEISLRSNRNASYEHAPEILIGDRSGLLLYIFNLKGIWNILSFVILAAGVLTILIYFCTKSYKIGNKGLLYLGVNVSMIGCWLLGESGLLQIVTTNTYLVTRITLIMQLIFPVSISLYVKETIPMKKRFFADIISSLAIINTVISLLLDYLNIFGLSDSFIIAISLIMLTSVYYMVVFLIETIVYKNKRAQKEFMALTILFFSIFVEIIVFYARGQTETTYFVLMGMAIYIVLMLIYQVQEYGDRIRLRNEREFYEKMAYTDALTGAKNRTIYIKDIEHIASPKGVTIVQVDTDRLKYINDYFDHACGDQAIINTYKVLTKYFEPIGKVYRVGGDEFTVILKNVEQEKIDKIVEKILEETKLINETCEYDFSISIGTAEYDASMDDDIHSITARADHDMYNNKKRLRGTVPQKYPITNLEYGDWNSSKGRLHIEHRVHSAIASQSRSVQIK